MRRRREWEEVCAAVRSFMHFEIEKEVMAVRVRV